MASYISNIVVCYDCNKSPDNRVIDFIHKLRCPLDNVKSIVVKNVWCIPNKISVSTVDNNDVVRLSMGSSMYFLKLTHGAYHVHEYIDEIQKRVDELDIPITLKIQSNMASCPDRDGRVIWHNDSFLRMTWPVMMDSTMTIDTLNNESNDDFDARPSFFKKLFGLVGGAPKVNSNNVSLNLRYDKSQLAFKGTCCLKESATLGSLRANMPWNTWQFSVTGSTVTIVNKYHVNIQVKTENGRTMFTSPSGSIYLDPTVQTLFVDDIGQNNFISFDQRGEISLIDPYGVVNSVVYDEQSRIVKKEDINGTRNPLGFTTFYMVTKTDDISNIRAFFDGAGNGCRAKVQYQYHNHDNHLTFAMNTDITSAYAILPKGIPINFTIAYLPGIFPETPNDINLNITTYVRSVDGKNHVKTKESIKEPMGLLLRCPEIESFIWQNRNHTNEGIAYFQYQELLNDQRTWPMTDEKSFSSTVPRFDRLTFWFQHIKDSGSESHDLIQSHKKLLQSVQVRIMLAVCFERPHLDARTHIGYLNPHIKEDTSVRNFDAYGTQEQDAFEKLVIASKQNGWAS